MSIKSYSLRYSQLGFRIILGALIRLRDGGLKLINSINLTGNKWAGLITVVTLAVSVVIWAYNSILSTPDKSRCFQPLKEFMAREKDIGLVKPPLLASGCNKEIVHEFIEPEILKDFPLQPRIRLFEHVIEKAKHDETFHLSDIANLYTALSSYYYNVNLTKSINSAKQALIHNASHPISKQFIEEFHASFEQPSSPKSGQLISIDKKYLQIFPWASLLEGYPKAFVKRRKDEILLAAYNRIADQKSLFAVSVKAELATNAYVGLKNPTLIRRFLEHHGACDRLPERVNQAQCYFIKHLDDIDRKDDALAWQDYSRALSIAEEIDATLLHFKIFTIHQEVRGKLVGQTFPDDDITPSQREERCRRYETAFRENGDVIAQALSALECARIVGFNRQDHRRARAEFEAAAKVLETYVGHDVYRRMMINYHWQAVEHGNRELFFDLLLEEYKQFDKSDPSQYISFLNKVRESYAYAGDLENANKYFDETVSVSTDMVSNINDFFKLYELLEKSIENRNFAEAKGVALKIEDAYKKNPNDNSLKEVLLAGLKFNRGIVLTYGFPFGELPVDQHKETLKNIRNIRGKLEKLKQKKGFDPGKNKIDKLIDQTLDIRLGEIDEDVIEKSRKVEVSRQCNKFQEVINKKDGKKFEPGNSLFEKFSIRSDEFKEYFDKYSKFIISIKDNAGLLCLEEIIDDKSYSFISKEKDAKGSKSLALRGRPYQMFKADDLLRTAYAYSKLGYRADTDFSAPVNETVLMALAASLVGDEAGQRLYVRDAIDLIDGKIGGSRNFPFEFRRDAQAVAMYAELLISECKFGSAVDALYQHDHVFDVEPLLREIIHKHVNLLESLNWKRCLER